MSWGGGVIPGTPSVSGPYAIRAFQRYKIPALKPEMVSVIFTSVPGTTGFHSDEA